MGSLKAEFYLTVAGEGPLVKELCGLGAESPHLMAESKMGTFVLHLQGIENNQQSE